jgi:hypothetical protein
MKLLIKSVPLLLVLAWLQSAAGQLPNHLTQNQWIQPVENGTLEGRLILPGRKGVEAVQGALVAMMSRGGDILKSETPTNGNGEFLVRGLKPGVYALTARADSVFACCAMQILDANDNLAQEYPRTAEISAAKIDFTDVNTALLRYLPPNVKPMEFSMVDAELDQLAPRVCSNNTHRVVQFGGGLKGRLHRPGAIGSDLDDARLTNVFIIQEGIEIARAVTNQQGEFQIDSLPPGHYSLMAIGPYGLGLIGLELVAPSTNQSLRTSAGKRLIGTLTDGCCQEFAMQVAPVQEVMTICEEVVIEQPLVDPCGCGQVIDQCGCGIPIDACGCEVIDDGLGTPLTGGYMGGGGYAGSYGGGYGGGGLGAIAGLAGIGGIIAVAASDDDDTPTGTVTPAPATPVVP